MRGEKVIDFHTGIDITNLGQVTCVGDGKVVECVKNIKGYDTVNKSGNYIMVYHGKNIEGKKIFISGPTKLKGATVEATDLRAGACMVLAGLVAHGTTTITNVEHILRGYENIVGKLESIGAKIELLDI